MSGAQHTPGPWHYELTVEETSFQVYALESDWIVEVEIDDFRTDEIAEANARLIAAAPELLAALRRVHDMALIRGGEHNSGWTAVLAAAGVALDKAEGRA